MSLYQKVCDYIVSLHEGTSVLRIARYEGNKEFLKGKPTTYVIQKPNTIAFYVLETMKSE